MMRTHGAFPTLILFLITLVVACDESPTSTCYECVSPIDGGTFVDVTEEAFTVGENAVVRVDDFAGKVTFRTGEPGAIRVIATRRAARRLDLDHIELHMSDHDGGLDLMSENPKRVERASVDFDVIAPADATAQIDVGAGAIDYEARPRGSFHFRVGAGSIRLRLPPDVGVGVELRAVVGSIFLEFPVDGQVSNRLSLVRGTIGHGGDGFLNASVAVGNIHVVRW